MAGVRRLCRFRCRWGDRQHDHTVGWFALVAGSCRQADRDRGELCCEFLAVAFRRIQAARSFDTNVGRMRPLNAMAATSVSRGGTNLTSERPTFVTHLECSVTAERYGADELHN